MIISCSKIDDDSAVEIVLKSYRDYVQSCASYPDLKNIPQYTILIPDGQDELAIELVPFLSRILASKKIKRKKFSFTISRILTNHENSIMLDKKLREINPHFDGDIYGIIKKIIEYLRRGLPSIRDDRPGSINLFNYTDFAGAINAIRNAFQNQDFSTLFFFHPEVDRNRFEKLLNDLKKNIPALVKAAKGLNISGLRLYRMEFLKFYETLMQNLNRQIEAMQSPQLQKLIDSDLFFLFRDISKGNDLMIYPDYKKTFIQKEKINIAQNTFSVIFTGNRKLDFTKEGSYWRLPVLPETFWSLPELKLSAE